MYKNILKQDEIRKVSAFEPISQTAYLIWNGNDAGNYGIGVIQVMDDDAMTQLSEYVRKNHLNIDLETLKNDLGVVILHNDVLSPENQEKVE